MADALKAQEQDPSARELSFLEVDQQWNWRENQTLSRRLKLGFSRQLGPIEGG
jgi:hypothetical protein